MELILRKSGLMVVCLHFCQPLHSVLDLIPYRLLVLRISILLNCPILHGSSSYIALSQIQYVAIYLFYFSFHQHLHFIW